MTPSAERRSAAGLLRDARVLRLLAAGLIADTGDWLLLIALPVYVLEQTGSTLVTSSVFVCELVPSLVLGPLAGVLVDRWNRRRCLVVAYLGQAAALLPLLAVTHGHHLALIYIVTFAQASLAQITEPARASLLPARVAPGELAAANGRGASLSCCSWSSWFDRCTERARRSGRSAACRRSEASAVVSCSPPSDGVRRPEH